MQTCTVLLNTVIHLTQHEMTSQGHGGARVMMLR